MARHAQIALRPALIAPPQLPPVPPALPTTTCPLLQLVFNADLKSSGTGLHAPPALPRASAARAPPATAPPALPTTPMHRPLVLPLPALLDNILTDYLALLVAYRIASHALLEAHVQAALLRTCLWGRVAL